MKKYKLATLPLILSIVLGGCVGNVKPQPIEISTAVVSKSSISTNVEVAGVFAPSNNENVNTKISGLIKTINAEVGKTVQKGDVLIELDTKDLQAQLAQSQAALHLTQDQVGIAKTNLDAAQVGVSSAQSSLTVTQSSIEDQIRQSKINVDAAQSGLDAVIEQNKVQLEQIQSTVDRAQDAYDKLSTLFNSGIVSKTDYDSAQTALDNAIKQQELLQTSANAGLTAAQLKLETAQTAYSQATGSTADSQKVAATSGVISAQSKVETAKKQYESSSSSSIEQAQAAVAAIETQISNATITAQMNGVVVNKNINVGELAQPGVSLVVLSDVSKLKLSGTIAQGDIPYIKVGQEVDVFADIYPDEPIKGTVESIGPTSIATGTYFPVQIIVNNADNKLMAGLSSHATIVAQKQDAIVIPTSSIVENDGKSYVFAIVDGKYVKKDVVIGLKNNESAEILNGLAEGDNIATTNVNTIFDGMEVNAK